MMNIGIYIFSYIIVRWANSGKGPNSKTGTFTIAQQL